MLNTPRAFFISFALNKTVLEVSVVVIFSLQMGEPDSVSMWQPWDQMEVLQTAKPMAPALTGTAFWDQEAGRGFVRVKQWSDAISHPSD